MKPFDTYQKDRTTLKALARTIQESKDPEEIEGAADKLSDLVLSILSDEDVSLTMEAGD